MAQKIHVFTDIRYLKILRAPRFHKPFTTMARLPWDKTLGHFMGASKAQLDVWERFTEVASRTAGMPLHERLQVIASEMRGFQSPNRRPRERVSTAQSTLAIIQRVRAEKR